MKLDEAIPIVVGILKSAGVYHGDAEVKYGRLDRRGLVIYLANLLLKKRGIGTLAGSAQFGRAVAIVQAEASGSALPKKLTSRGKQSRRRIAPLGAVEITAPIPVPIKIDDVDVTSDEFLSTYAWRQLRYKALIKYGAKCQCCGASRETGAVINVDHIKSRRNHPELAMDINNLQVLCHDCNHGKGNTDETDWRSPDRDIEADLDADALRDLRERGLLN